MILNIPVGSLHLGEEIHSVISRSRGELSWVMVLPGQWGADDARRLLEADGRLLHLDASLAAACPAGALREALGAIGRLPPPGTAAGETTNLSRQQVRDALIQWAEENNGGSDDAALPMIFIDSPELLDETSVEILEELLTAGRLRMGAVVPTAEALPGYLVRQWRVGKLQLLRAPLMTVRDLERGMWQRLDASVSPSVLQRMTSLCGRHAGLADKVLDVARSSKMMYFDGYTWRWGVDESHFLAELALVGGVLLSRFSDAERELLIMTAVCGSLPADWAAQRYGEETVQSLATQRLLGPEAGGAQGFLDLRITAEAVQAMVLSGVTEIEKGRLWHLEGRKIPADVGGPASQAARTHWRAAAEGAIEPRPAYDAARYAITRGWYQHVLDLAERLRTPCARVQLLAARAHLALGDAGAALNRIRRHVVEPAKGDSAPEHQVMCQAAVLAERIALFHPHLAAPVIAQLQALSPVPLTPHLDELREVLAQNEHPPYASPVSLSRPQCHDEECILGRLWLGARLGLRLYPDMGRLMLASVLDDLVREGGSPDVEESALALLLLITGITGWRTEVLNIAMHLRPDDAARRLTVPAVADVIAAVSAMQQDRMVEAYHYALSARRTFAAVDPFGLYAFAASLAAATSSYVDEDLSKREHQRYWALSGTGVVQHGPSSLRLATEGMALVGSGMPRDGINGRLLQLAHTARSEQEWAQEQQLLLLALLGGSRDASEAVLTAPWNQDPGRPGMIGMLARALSDSTSEEAVAIAELLIDGEATYFGLTILTRLWHRRNRLSRRLRTRIIHILLAVRRREGEESWLVKNEADLQLDAREFQTLQLLEDGHSSREIARQLQLSQRTVEATISALCQRFACANRVELLGLGLLEE